MWKDPQRQYKVPSPVYSQNAPLSWSRKCPRKEAGRPCIVVWVYERTFLRCARDFLYLQSLGRNHWWWMWWNLPTKWKEIGRRGWKSPMWGCGHNIPSILMLNYMGVARPVINHWPRITLVDSVLGTQSDLGGLHCFCVICPPKPSCFSTGVVSESEWVALNARRKWFCTILCCL